MKNFRKALSTLVALVFLSSNTAFAADEEQMQINGNAGEGQEAAQYLNGKIQAGYHVPTFVQIDRTQKERVDRRNGVEHMVVSSHRANPEAQMEILNQKQELDYNAAVLQTEINYRFGQATKIADTHFMNRYVPSEDGKIERFQNGLLVQVDNERVVDEYGHESRKFTYNMKYYDNRMLESYEANTFNAAGVKTHERLFGIKYTPDSVYYGNFKTKADQLRTEYYLETSVDMPETGKNWTRMIHWKTNPSDYTGKFLTSFSESIQDNLYGNHEFTQTDIQYETTDPRKVSGFHEEGYRFTNSIADAVYYTKNRSETTYNNKMQVLHYKEDTSEARNKSDLEAGATPDSRTITDVTNTYILNTFHTNYDDATDLDNLSQTIIKSYTMEADHSWYGSAAKPAVSTTTYTYNELPGNRRECTGATSIDTGFGGDEDNQIYEKSAVSSYDAYTKLHYGTPVLTKTVTTTNTYTKAKVDNTSNKTSDLKAYPFDPKEFVPGEVLDQKKVELKGYGGIKHAISTMDYNRDQYGLLDEKNAPQEKGQFWGHYGYADTFYWGTTSTSFAVINQQAKQKDSETLTNFQPNAKVEGSEVNWSQSRISSHYVYDANGNIVLANGSDKSYIKETTIGYENGRGAYKSETYDVDNPQAVLNGGVPAKLQAELDEHNVKTSTDAYELNHGKLKQIANLIYTIEGSKYTEALSTVKRPWEDAVYTLNFNQWKAFKLD